MGWQPEVTNGMMTGTVGRGLAMDAVRMALSGTALLGELTANAHVQSIGWTGWIPKVASSEPPDRTCASKPSSYG